MTERTYLGGMTDTVIHEESDGTIIVEERQDCQSILDSNARKRNERFSSSSPEGFVQESYDIPMVLMHRWALECGHALFSKEFEEYMNRQLKQPEFKYLVSAPCLRDPHIIVRGAR
jgi:hypothetical protein